jgi:hypothetical protein
VTPYDAKFLFSLRPLSGDNSSEFSLVSISEEPLIEMHKRRHIHFNDKVDQCIAVDIEDCDNCEDREGYSIYGDDSSSDDGLMMKRSSKINIPNRSMRCSSCGSFNAANLSIAVLPPTTLKHRKDPLELDEPASRQGGEFWSSGFSSPPLRDSPWQMSLKVLSDGVEENVDVLCKPSGAFADHIDMIATAHDILTQNALINGGENRSDEGKDGEERAGLWGWIVDTVNTAKDMAYILWNVGWG